MENSSFRILPFSSSRVSYLDLFSVSLTHIKYKNKTQYAPEAVVTLAGTDYMDYFNAYKASWEKARNIVAKKGGKTCERRYKEAETKLDSGELTFEELADTEEYCDLLTNPKYGGRLQTKSNLVNKVCKIHFETMKKKIANKKITTWGEIEASKHFNLLRKYGHEQDLKEALKSGLREKIDSLLHDIREHKISLLFDEIEACDEYKEICQHFREQIEKEIRKRAYIEYRYFQYNSYKITSISEVKTSEKYKYAYFFYKDDIGSELKKYGVVTT